MSSQTKIRIKCSEIKINTRVELLSISENFYIECSKIVTSGRDSEFHAYNHFDEGAEKLFDVNCTWCTNALKSLEREAVMPLKLKTDHSVFNKRIDKYIYVNNTDEIFQEIKHCNPDVHAVEIFKFPNSIITKIFFRCGHRMSSSRYQNLQEVFIPR